MRKVFGIVFLMCLLALPGLAFADKTKNTSGGFLGPAVQDGPGYAGPVATMTVKEALELRDDARVILQGNIVQYLGKDNYMFTDKTGSVTIEIDDDFDWEGQSVGPDDTVIIFGKVDRDFKDFEIEVKRLVKLPEPK